MIVGPCMSVVRTKRRISRSQRMVPLTHSLGLLVGQALESGHECALQLRLRVIGAQVFRGAQPSVDMDGARSRRGEFSASPENWVKEEQHLHPEDWIMARNENQHVPGLGDALRRAVTLLLGRP